jgi:23S rRNA pseudouridine1911/1915/1917 synthase
MLHAARLVVTHPITGKSLEIKAPLPADFSAVSNALAALPEKRR